MRNSYQIIVTGFGNLSYDQKAKVDTFRPINSKFIPKAEVLIVECKNLTRKLLSSKSAVCDVISGLSLRLENLSFATNTPYWNLMDGLAEESFRLTDQVHMDRKSADLTLRAILGELKR